MVEEEAVLAHGGVKGFFPGMSKGGMANVMDQREGFDEVAIQSELRGDRPRDLRHFDRVGQAIAKMIGVTPRENLRLRVQTPKRAGMNDAVAIALKVVSVGMRRLGMTASAGIFYVDGIVGELGVRWQSEYPVASLPL